MAITIDDACDVLRGRIRRLPLGEGKNLTKLSEKMGLSHITLKNFMNGLGSPSLETLYKLENYCDRAQMLSGEE